ncbi:hypothetical protein AB1Y20_018415 [Prymnesium parvum]|uniref:AP-2 complex subunit alpha n=1 Tax=Prymnesium parvum TaxID=97485 RepID=A0AB34JRK4_PRYPA
MAMRGLTVFISDLRNCATKEQEEKRVEKEMAHIRSKFTSDTHMNGYNRKKYVWKILYMYMLGYEVDFGHMEAVNLISSPKYSEKSVGYAWCALMLREGDELLRLIINSIRSDLIGRNDNAVCLALHSICNVGGKEFSESLSSEVLKLLTENTTKTFVRKKAALTTLRLYRKAPDMLPASEWAEKILLLLEEKNIGVLTSISSLILGIMNATGPEGWEASAAKAARTLTRLVLNKDYSNDYLYYGIPTPWLQIKLLRMLQFFPPPDEHALKMRVSEVLQRIISGTDVTKNVNKNNATHAILFEAINLVIHLGNTTDLLPQAISLLGRFISIREANIRYLGLETMARLSQAQPDTMESLKKHQSTIIFSLKDADISIRRRALDLVYSMCDTSSVKDTVQELLNFLDTSDSAMREELVLKIAILAERFATDNQWYVDVVLSLIKGAGDFVSDEIWYRVVQIITNQGDDLQKYAAKTVWTALSAEVVPHRTLVKVAGYVLGEFGYTIADEPGSGAQEQLALLQKLYTQADVQVRALLLNTYVKLAHTFAEIAPQVKEILEAASTAMDQEMQQRSVEYIALSQFESLKEKVLEVMPHFTERESIVQKALQKGNLENAVNMPAASAGTRSAAASVDDSDPPSYSAARAPARAPAPAEDLLGMDDGPSASAPVDSLANDLLEGLGGLGSSPSPPQPTSSADDLLGLMGGPPAPTPTPTLPSGGGGLDDLLGGIGDAPAPPSAPAPAPAPTGGPTPQFTALCLRNDGVLHEDANLQIGIKMEFQGHQGRLALYFGNKTTAPLVSVATQYSPSPALNVVTSPLPAMVNPRAQAQQMLNLECLGPYGEPIQLALRFSTASGPQQLMLPLPLPATKFLQPLTVDGPEFFRRWKGLEGKEKQEVFKLATNLLDAARVQATLGNGMRFALLTGVDPNPANYVASAWLATKGCSPQADAASVLARVEVNSAAGMCRLSVRSSDPAFNQTLSKLLHSQLGSS